jgi:hypothetical protein
MNERIRELAHEAGLPTYNPEGIPTKLEKFAELIIKECLDQLLISDPTEDFDKGVAWSSRQIKKHFGVES